MHVVGLRQGGEISSGVYTYCWPGIDDDTCLKEVAAGISSRLQPFMVDEHIMQVWMQRSLGSISLVAVYVLTEMCEAAIKELFYGKLNSLVFGSPPSPLQCHYWL